jgi:nicotinamidase-related amidase
MTRVNLTEAASAIQLPTTLAELVDPRSTALVMWDMQKGLAGQAPNAGQLAQNGRRLVDAADAAGVTVIWSKHIYLPLALMNGPWQRYLMRKNKVADPEKLRPALAAARSRSDFIDGLSPAPHHIVIEKYQPSLFLDTPLENFLTVRGIRSLVLTGFTTDIGIEFTARHAHARGYFSVVVEDATGAYDPAEHDRSIMFLRKWVDVSTTAEIAAAWRGVEGR